MGKNILSLFALITASLFVPMTVHAQNMKGKVNVSDYFSSDSGNYDFHIITSRIKLYAPEKRNGGFYFNLNGRIRKKISDKDIHSDIPDYYLKELWMGYKSPEGSVKFILGRQIIEEMFNSYIDGGNVKFLMNKKFSVGLFGGRAPDRFDYSFTSKYRSLGFYLRLDLDNQRLMAGYENLAYKGKTDREYLSLRWYSMLPRKIVLNVISSASFNQDKDRIDLENVILNLLIPITKVIRVDLFYDFYRALRYFESAKKFANRIDPDDSYYLDYNPQIRTGARIDYLLSRDMKFTASCAYQKRDIDDEDALRFTGGFRHRNLIGFDVFGQYAHIEYYTSQNDEFSVEFTRDVLEDLQISLNGSYGKESFDVENGKSASIFEYGATFTWYINQYFSFFVSADRYEEESYDNTSLFAQGEYRF